MKGKYTNAAERRRHLEDLTERAETAERKAAKLAEELAVVRTSTDALIAELRGQVAELKRQRDAVTSPELQAAERRIGELREQCGIRDDVIRGLGEGIEEIKSSVAKRLLAAGFDESERLAVLKQITTDGVLNSYGEALGRGDIRAEEISPDMARIDGWLSDLSAGWRK